MDTNTSDSKPSLAAAGLNHQTGRKRQDEEHAGKTIYDCGECFRAITDFEYNWEFWVSPEGKFLDISPSFERITGYNRGEFKDKQELVERIVHPDDKQMVLDHLADSLPSRRIYNLDFRIIRRDGHIIWINHACQPVFSTDGALVGRRASNMDITERKRTEEELKLLNRELERRVAERTTQLFETVQKLEVEIAERKKTQELIRNSLQEKEEMLKEIHHRVKNNLQVISSLLDLHSMRADDQRAITLITDARLRIHTLAMIHSQLYHSGRFDQVDMESHLRELVFQLSQVHATPKRITPSVVQCAITLPVSQAIPCALVFNELISNAFMHAFPDREEGAIDVSLQRLDDGTVLAQVKDNGIGLPQEIDILRTASLGLKLVNSLVREQLHGKIWVVRATGTLVCFSFTSGEVHV